MPRNIIAAEDFFMKRITVLAPSFVLTSILALVPALARIADAFPHVSTSAIQMLVTRPSLVAFPVILLPGVLSGLISKKRIALLSLFLMLVGGLIPFFFYQSFGVLLAAGALFGLGLGGISPMTTALVYEHFPKDTEAMLGYMGAILGAGGMLFSFLGGFLATIEWRYAYLSFLLVVPVIVLVFLLPRGVVQKDGARFTGLFNGALVYYLVQCVIASIGFNVFNTNIAMYIQETGLGDAGTSGLVTSVYAALSVVGGILTGKIMGRLQRYTLSVLFLAAGVGMLSIFIGHTLVLVGAFLIGFTFSVFMPAGYSRATQSAPAAASTLAISVYCCSHQLGQFLTPFAINGVTGLTGGGVAAKFLLAFVILIVLFVVSLLREKSAARAEGRRLNQAD